MTTVTVDSTVIERPTRYANTSKYCVAELIMPNVPTPVAGGAGQTVTVSIVASEENLPADLNYTIKTTPSMACSVKWANKTVAGFDLILTPLSSGVTLAAGFVDVTVTWESN